MRAGLVWLTLALFAVALAVPAIAQAYRPATPAEQSEMERSAVLYLENPNSDVPGTNVTVTNVKVSTAAPSWALASVAVTAKATGEQAGGPEAFRKIAGTWTDVGFFNEERASMLPEAVAKDFGVPYVPSNASGTSSATSGDTSTSGSSLEGFLKVETLVSWFIGLLAMLSAWLRRPSHFKSIGRSKLAWMGITTLGLIPIVGFIPALIYFWRVYLHLPAKHPEDHTRTRPKPVPRGPSRSAEYLVECDMCRGRKMYLCHSCGGRFPAVQDCYCSNGWISPCDRCKGTGTVRGSPPRR